MAGVQTPPVSCCIVQSHRICTIPCDYWISINTKSDMNSKERHEARYRRRKEKRLLKKKEVQKELSFDKMTDFREWLKALKKCKVNVSWKGSVQWYMQHPLSRIIDYKTSIGEMKYPYYPNTKRVVIYERGKARYIVPITIDKRHVEHVFCDSILTPAITRKLIMDNGASIEGKGTQFSRARIVNRLAGAIKEFGTDFYYWQFDFKKFFESIPMKTCKMELLNLFDDRRIVGFAMKCLSDYHLSNISLCKEPVKAERLQMEFMEGKSRGICLGSQVSQMLALIVPNRLDHFITNHCSYRYYERYMDDGIVFSKTKEELRILQQKCEKIINFLGLELSKNKTKISPISKSFVFLKVRYRVSKTGKIIKTIYRSSPIRMRRRLKRFYHLVKEGKMSMQSVADSFQSWYNHCKKVARTYRTRRRMLKLYQSLFGNYGLEKILKAS